MYCTVHQFIGGGCPKSNGTALNGIVPFRRGTVLLKSLVLSVRDIVISDNNFKKLKVQIRSI